MQRLLLLFLSGIISLSTKAQPPVEKTLLWQITPKGQKPSYLFGTIHVLCPDKLMVSEVIKEKFNTTSTLFLEVDLDDPDLMKKMLVHMQMKGSQTLPQLLGNQYDSISTIFQSKTGMPLTMLNKAKPFFSMTMIYPALLGCVPVSWETLFQKMAKDKNLNINGLETVEDQMEVFEKIPYQVQASMLANTILQFDSSQHQLNQMLQLYENKDIAALQKVTTGDADFGKYEGILLNDRNKNWIPVIAAQVAKNPSFFAVGAAHLGGENGVINLLRKAGFTVIPIFYQ